MSSFTKSYKYKFNGKEYQDELGLNVTAMDWRQYDNAIGRFNSIDKLSEVNYEQSPYHFSNNNPITFSDPTGLDEGLTGINSSGSQYASYLTSWAASIAYLNVSLGSSSNWGESDINGNYSEFADWFSSQSSYTGSDNANQIRGLYNYYASNNGYSTTDDGLISTTNEKPYVKNKSSETIFYKPELSGEALPLAPGEKTHDDIDGLKVRNNVYKVTDNYMRVIVRKDFKVEVYYSFIGNTLINFLRGGHAIRSDFHPNDHGWDELFKK